MTRKEIRNYIRLQLDDIVGSNTSRNWTDDELNLYIYDACLEIAKRTLCLKESILESVCNIPIVQDTIHYALSPLILEVISVRKSWDGLRLSRVVHEEYEKEYPMWDTVDVKPHSYMTDYSRGYLSLVGKISTTITTEALKLSVYRLPALTTDAVEIDLPFACHNKTYNYVLYRCFMKQSEETFNADKAFSYRNSFEGKDENGKGGDIRQIIMQLYPSEPHHRHISSF